MLLTGYTGQISLGHAAFLAVGAYTEAVLQAKGVPFGVSLIAAGALAGLAGIVIGLPALRLTGIYLAIATIAFGFIVQEVLTRWESVTRGNSGITVKSISVGSFQFDAEWKLYYLALGLLVLAVTGVMNLLRAPTGRAFVAIRDSEISAQSMGIHLARTKTTAFALSAALTGIAGALYAHKLVFISPEQFGILLSIELAMMIFIGGIGSLHGAVYGAIFLIALPQVIAVAKDYLPAAIGHQTGLEPTVFGLIMVLVILFEPLGIYGRWLKVRHYLETFPLYKKDSFRRQKTFMKSERLR
jgi:branched-chain amino acid transport system permease protein